MSKTTQMTRTCQKCGAKCCRYFCFEIDEPEDFEDFDDIRWYLFHEGVTVHIDEGDWYISIENRCKALDENNLCTAYDERPLICRKYNPPNCDNSEADYGYDELFTCPEELEAYARKILGDKAYEKARDKARAKLEKKAAKKAKPKTGKKAKGSKKS